MKLLFLVITFFSMVLIAQVSEDPNMAIDSNNESGTTFAGSDKKAQKPTCEKCQEKKVLLTQDKHRADKSTPTSGNQPTTGAKGTR